MEGPRETVLVVGGCGELGWEVVRASVTPSSGFARVVTTFHSTTPTDAEREAVPGAEWVALDCGDHEAARSLLTTSGASSVIYCAVPRHGGASGKPKDSVRRGIVDDVVNLAEAASISGVRFVALSTDLVFDGNLDTGKAYGEPHSTSPTSFYGATKAEMEQALLAIKGTCIARTSLILTLADSHPGSLVRQHHGKGIQFVLDALEGKLSPQGGAFTMFTDELRCMSFSDDLAAALLQVANPTCSYTGILHLVAEEISTRYDLAVRLAKHFKLEDTLGVNVQPGLSADSGLDRPLNCALATDRIQTILGGTGVRIRGLSERLP